MSSKWIKIETVDDLPPLGVEVLVCNAETSEVVIDWLAWDHRSGEPYWNSFNEPDDPTTHWMYMPEAPVDE